METKGISAEKFMPFFIKYTKFKNPKERKYQSYLWQQKILFFIHFEYLRENKIFFKDNFEAWVYGPIISNVFDLQKEYKNWLIDFKIENLEKLKECFLDKFKFEKTQNELEKMWNSFENTFQKYEKFSPIELIEKTHKLNSWNKNFTRDLTKKEDYFSIYHSNNIISNEDLEEDLKNFKEK